MDFTTSSTAQDYLRRLAAFMQEHVLPAEGKYCSEIQNVADWHTWKQPFNHRGSESQGKAAGLWNLFLPDKRYGAIGFDECQVDGHFGHLC